MKLTLKPCLAALALAFTLAAPQAFAQSNKWGLGLRFGSPTAFTIKRYISERNALDINLGAGQYGLSENGYGRYRGRGFSAMINYLWRQDVGGAGGLEFYYGVGGLLSVRSYYYDDRRRDVYNTRAGLGLTGAVGLEYFIPRAPISLFLEANPYVEVFPAPFWVNLGGALGGRCVF